MTPSALSIIEQVCLERDAALVALKQQMEDCLRLHEEIKALKSRNERLSAAVEDWDVEGSPI